MNGELYTYFFDDHRELEEKLAQAAAGETIAMGPYRQFREGLLRHIAMEERVLIPVLKKHGPERLQSTLHQIQLDHSAIGALLVPPPTHAILDMITHILDKHNVLEEADSGMYDACESLDEDVVEDLIRRARETPPVKVNPNNPNPGVIPATRRAVERAGYDGARI